MSLEYEPGPAGQGAGGGQSRQRWRLLDDPVAIRALAHPLRHDLMSIIGRLGQATTADAAREIGISHGPGVQLAGQRKVAPLAHLDETKSHHALIQLDDLVDGRARERYPRGRFE